MHHKLVNVMIIPLNSLKVLAWRSFLQKRGTFVAPAVIVNVLVTATAVVILWWRTPGVLDLVGAVFFCVINQCYMGSTIILRLFPQERDLMLRERSSKYYPLSAYYFAKTAVDATVCTTLILLQFLCSAALL